LVKNSDLSKSKRVASLCIQLGAPKILMNNILHANERLKKAEEQEEEAKQQKQQNENNSKDIHEFEWKDLREKTLEVLFEISDVCKSEMNEIFKTEKNNSNSIWFPALKELYLKSMKKGELENELIWIQKLFQNAYKQ